MRLAAQKLPIPTKLISREQAQAAVAE